MGGPGSGRKKGSSGARTLKSGEKVPKGAISHKAFLARKRKIEKQGKAPKATKKMISGMNDSHYPISIGRG